MLGSLEDALREGDGWISFARYMEIALSAYYAAGAEKFGASGDFVTAPELGTLFGRTLARQLSQLGYEDVLEIGAGTGALAATLLAHGNFRYHILEPSPTLKARQQALLGQRASWLDGLPARIRGIVLANEVVDALPVHAVAWRKGGVMERGVALHEGRLVWRERRALGALAEAAKQIPVEAPYESEIGLVALAWMQSLASRLEEGAIFVFDYGFPQREYYHPQRSSGTLMSHRRHRSHIDPFAHPGEEDISAHVDFSALAKAACDAGLEVLGYTTQAQFLINCGITEVLNEANADNALHYAPLAAEAHTLLSPAEMGELFKVLAAGRGVARPLLGFSRADRAASL